MKKSKALMRVERVQQMIDLAFDECDCDTANVTVSSLFNDGQPHTVLTMMSENIAVQAILPQQQKSWDGFLAIQYKKSGLQVNEMVRITNLIDEIQKIKDERRKNEHL